MTTTAAFAGELATTVPDLAAVPLGEVRPDVRLLARLVPDVPRVDVAAFNSSI
ncbi:hypothetical protein IMZ11_02440 [Microtetraspora sp. AC03309]|uniref:hypothetical protein n=1 Tax=Microtetraspora sp. AC03309 TaxID=2779376 RepID=UPI001E3A7DCB|nr:hypothetical protein [Microtetraspora sp. AC03309]MCC5574499.1 hypothetical protein [Microtetraspora sp. AC03309]